MEGNNNIKKVLMTLYLFILHEQCDEIIARICRRLNEKFTSKIYKPTSSSCTRHEFPSCHTLCIGETVVSLQVRLRTDRTSLREDSPFASGGVYMRTILSELDGTQRFFNP